MLCFKKRRRDAPLLRQRAPAAGRLLQNLQPPEHVEGPGRPQGTETRRARSSKLPPFAPSLSLSHSPSLLRSSCRATFASSSAPTRSHGPEQKLRSTRAQACTSIEPSGYFEGKQQTSQLFEHFRVRGFRSCRGPNYLARRARLHQMGGVCF